MDRTIERLIYSVCLQCCDSMDTERHWNEITEWLSEEKSIHLPRGKEFLASFNRNEKVIVVIPSETGIPRRIAKDEWKRFGEKFADVENRGYDPLKPGHYASITFNSSYLVAILKEYGSDD